MFLQAPQRSAGGTAGPDMLTLRAGQACLMLSASAHLGLLAFGHLLPMVTPTTGPATAGTLQAGRPATLPPGPVLEQTVELRALPVPSAVASPASAQALARRPLPPLTVRMAQHQPVATPPAPVQRPPADAPQAWSAAAPAPTLPVLPAAPAVPATPLAQAVLRPLLSAGLPAATGVEQMLPPINPEPSAAASLTTMAAVPPIPVHGKPAVPTLAAAPAPNAEWRPVRYLEAPTPVYPAAARRLGEEGLVVVRVQVEADGQPGPMQVVQGSHFADLDAAALAALRAWRFAPAQRGSVPQASLIDIPLRFSLRTDLASAP